MNNNDVIELRSINVMLATPMKHETPKTERQNL